MSDVGKLVVFPSHTIPFAVRCNSRGYWQDLDGNLNGLLGAEHSLQWWIDRYGPPLQPDSDGFFIPSHDGEATP